MEILHHAGDVPISAPRRWKCAHLRTAQGTPSCPEPAEPAEPAAAQKQEAAAESSSGDLGVIITTDQTASRPHSATKLKLLVEGESHSTHAARLPRQHSRRGRPSPTATAPTISAPRARRGAQGPDCCSRLVSSRSPCLCTPHQPTRHSSCLSGAPQNTIINTLKHSESITWVFTDPSVI